MKHVALVFWLRCALWLLLYPGFFGCVSRFSLCPRSRFRHRCPAPITAAATTASLFLFLAFLCIPTLASVSPPALLLGLALLCCLRGVSRETCHEVGWPAVDNIFKASFNQAFQEEFCYARFFRCKPKQSQCYNSRRP